MLVQAKLAFHDGYVIHASFPSWGAACRWAEEFRHHIQCDRNKCVHGTHNTRRNLRPVTLTISTLIEQRGSAQDEEATGKNADSAS